jgi:hypothetical protein
VKEIGHRQVYDFLQSRKPRAPGGELWGKRFWPGRPAGAMVDDRDAGVCGQGVFDRHFVRAEAKGGVPIRFQRGGGRRRHERHRRRNQSDSAI